MGEPLVRRYLYDNPWGRFTVFLWRLSVTYNLNYLFAVHTHQREKIISFYFWTVGHIFGLGEPKKGG